MKIKYNIDIDTIAIDFNLKRIINQTYKLLPIREEGKDWEKFLTSLIEEVAGMAKLLQTEEEVFFNWLSKMEGLFTLVNEEDFLLYRKTIFESLNLLSIIRRKICQL